jgi:DNA-binding CsgD family transcriptional regulator
MGVQETPSPEMGVSPQTRAQPNGWSLLSASLGAHILPLSPEPAPPAHFAKSNKWAIFALVATGAFMTTLDSSIVSISLPSIARAFGVPLGGTVEWVIIGYLVVMAAGLLTAGRLADMLGRKPIPGRPHDINIEQEHLLLARLEAAPDATVGEHCAWWAGQYGQQLSERLTPQELQIALLAAEGLSNREIGQRLYLSHRTVGFHLYRIFPKLGLTSRAELNAALGVSRGDK